MTIETSTGRLHRRRRPTRSVQVGDLEVGSDHPIRVQSMTTPATTDVAATVAQIERLADAGCEIVRVTVPTSRDAESLPEIRRQLEKRSIRVPLVADIHFTPAAAMKAIEHVDKIRINPGNYADKKKFAVREYTDAEYDAELVRIERTFSPLVERAKRLGRSMRIGTNHGSLSDRIMNRYGDTPEGMVESALEFVRICEARDYRELILSMKASNPLVVLQAYRLLARRMDEQGMDYPIHLGVTEAGDGEDGRIKSAIGIGALLDDGIGDTIRVSLTEDPVKEIPVARALVEDYERIERSATRSDDVAVPEIGELLSCERRPSHEIRVGPRRVGGENPVLVEVPLGSSASADREIRRELDSQVGVSLPQEARAELVSVTMGSDTELEQLERLMQATALVAPQVAISARVDVRWLLDADDKRLERWLGSAHRLHLPLAPPIDATTRSGIERLLQTAADRSTALLVEAGSANGEPQPAVDLALEIARMEPADGPHALMVALTPLPGVSPLRSMRSLARGLFAAGRRTPLVLLDRPAEREADGLLGPSASLGGLLCEGIGDSVHIESPSADDSRRLTFGILQAARVRITRTEFISCPSCGRTLFDLEETTARIKGRTAHLKGVKIAVMGCVVNGPGEMADADFGYVGWGEEKIALFVGKEMVAKDVPTAEADERLIELIKAHGRWVDPPAPAGRSSG